MAPTGDDAMPKPGTIPAIVREHLTLPSMTWLGDALAGGIVRGGTYLLSGEPGIGKSTLAVQIAGDMAAQGIKALYLANEQGLDDVEATLMRLFARGDRLPRRIADNFHMDDSLSDIEALPAFFGSHVEPPGREYSGAEVIVLDSIQGRGLPSSATRKYRALYEFIKQAKAGGIATILLSHITKDGRIAGPKALEHNVDAVMYLLEMSA